MTYYDLMTVREHLDRAKQHLLEYAQLHPTGVESDPVRGLLAVAVGQTVAAVEELTEGLKEVMRGD